MKWLKDTEGTEGRWNYQRKKGEGVDRRVRERREESMKKWKRRRARIKRMGNR